MVVVMVAIGKKFKTIQVTEETWLRLSRLKVFPEKANFEEVVKALLDERQKRDEAKELL